MSNPFPLVVARKWWRTRTDDGIRSYPCIFRQTRLSWKRQFSPSHRNFEHCKPRDRIQRRSILMGEKSMGVRNYKSKKEGGGKGGWVVLKVRDISHLNHEEIVLVTNDDDILCNV